ncbi:unnamed protein product [Closterium sp. NIES-64]|nr:unnamed protein product [Closterium sp. NIES-64]
MPSQLPCSTASFNRACLAAAVAPLVFAPPLTFFPVSLIAPTSSPLPPTAAGVSGSRDTAQPGACSCGGGGGRVGGGSGGHGGPGRHGRQPVVGVPAAAQPCCAQP